MYIRFHKGQFVDAVIPSAIGTQPSISPGDVLWSISGDINPTKTITVTQNVQAVDTTTGQPLVNEDESPQWQTQTVTNPDGTTSEQIVTQQVPEVVYLWKGLLVDSTQFTQNDITQAVTAAGLTSVVVGSIDEAKASKLAELQQAYEDALNGGFKSSADGTGRTYGFTSNDRSNLEEATDAVLTGAQSFPVPYADIDGNSVPMNQTEWAQFQKDAASFKLEVLTKLRQLKAQALAATTEEAISAVVW